MFKYVAVAVMALLCFSCVMAESEDQGRLIVHKSLTSDFLYFTPGKTFNSSISIYNVGSGSAYNVKITDDWGESFNSTAGDKIATFDEIKAGEHVTVNQTLIPLSEGELRGFVARVEYQPTADASPQFGFSSPMRNVTIIPNFHYDRLTATFTGEWVVFLGGLLAAIVVPLLLYSTLRQQYPEGVPASTEAARAFIPAKPSSD